MIHNTFVLDERYPDATLTTYIHEYCHGERIRPAVIVCPGGGYHNLSPNEADPMAIYYANAGMNTFLLRYSIGERASEFRPLIEAALAIRHVREHAEEYCIDPNKIVICGFSAGGHLAASAGILWNHPAVRDALGITDGSPLEGINRPDGMILSYPVITSSEFRHVNSFRYLCGKQDPSDEERLVFSLDHHVDNTTPPTFIWHTFTDQVVPIESAVFLINALNKHKVPFEAHIFPEGPHGLATSFEDINKRKNDYTSHVGNWARLSVEWIEELFRGK